ncbi:diguanylate cyclase domain-containing protein [Nannocystis pusilla]|uniref:diguanylate cyclase domain-containing protein n=1 Tax=Nannocystis pusilla TaxID=889268 RepID=UPI003DA55DD3
MAQAQSRISEYLSSEDERPFINKAYDRSLDDAGRLAYAKLVEARDPARAEWLRLEVALHSRPAADPAVIARFIELGRQIGFDFANLLLRDVIMNCGSDSAKRERPRVRFLFACTKRWETLAPTDSDSVRFCQQCKEQVYYCDTVADAETRALAGQCIAIPKQLSDGGVESHAMGRPDPTSDWAGRLFSGFRRATAGSCYLVILASGDAATVGQHHVLEAASAPITVGRGEHNALVLGGDSASRSHGRFEKRTDGWWVVDNGSTNGTYVNGQQKQEAPLSDGDRVRIGDTLLKVVDAPPLVESTYASSELDGLTGLHKRHQLVDLIERELQTAKISGKPLSLVLLDIDRFKRINDTYGHLAGDQLLRDLVQRLRAHVPSGAVLARQAGDRFALLLPGTGPEGAAALAEQIRTDVAGHTSIVDGQSLSLTLTAGIAQASDANCTVDRLIAAAADHLHAARLASRRQQSSP